MKLMHWIFAVCLFTASCDLILNFDVGGSIRLCQILMVLICLGAAARIVQDGRILWPRGATALSLWILSQFIFLPLCGNWTIGLMFFGLLLFTSIGVLAVVQLYGQSDMVGRLMKVYLGSYVFIGTYGMLQFLLPLAGLRLPLTMQWYIRGHLARVNGFSQEPSYFATYMVMGWITLLDLRLSKADIVQGRFWKGATVILTMVMLCSTSKLAWGIMIVELVARGVPPVWHALKSLFSRGKLVVYLPSARVLGVLALGLIFAFSAIRFLNQHNFNPVNLLGGSGLGGTAAHSVDTRMGDTIDTFEAFKDSPFIGRSLGGTAVYRGLRKGVVITNMEQARLNWGFPVILDVLLASGIIGFIPFLVFLYATTFGAMSMAKRYWPEERAKWLRALGRAMIFEWLMLSADQNLFRVYLWFHLTMVLVVAYHLEFAPAPELASQALESPEVSYYPTFEAPAAL